MSERMFVAIAPPRNAMDHLHENVIALQSTDPGHGWVPRTKWHVTLHFLGDSWQRPVVAELLEHVSLTAAPTLRLVGSGRFGRAAWIGVRSQDPGSDLQPTVRTLRAALPTAETRDSFTPHLTVCWTEAPVERALDGYSGPWWQPEEIILLRSITGDRPRFERVFSTPWA